ncbi:MAG: FtsQ-type POTRA domain-containing protein [Chloroflexi bacterium]|jgi:cell division protein FtsQ|nr:FtsQ-type POTRA domain-containing protein [Chloroflexota bacterium]
MANRNQGEMSRAEQVRARRQQKRKKQPSAPLGSSVTRKPKARNVTVPRRANTPTPVVTRKKHATYVPIKKKVAEFQLPALPRLQLGWRLFSGAVFLFALTVVISFSSLGTFRISTINLKGAQRLSPEVVLAQLDLVDKSIITIEPDVVKDKVEASLPGIKNAQVSIKLPAKVTIQVEEREPIILWEQEGSSQWIDAEGVLFPVFGEEDVPQRVVAVGDPPSAPTVPHQEIDVEMGEISPLMENVIPRTTPEFVAAVLSITKFMPEGSQLQYDSQFGLGWQDPNGWLVYFGQETANIDTKLIEYQEILTVLNQQNITPALISLEFIHAPYYRMEQ